MGEFGIGQSVRRTEDDRLLKGEGRYQDDINIDGQAHASFVRSPHAHAKIISIDTEAAAAMPGVIRIATSADVIAAGFGPLPCIIDHMLELKRQGDLPRVLPVRPILATDRVRHGGEPVAMVIAETFQQARDAAEAVHVEYEVLPSTTDTAASAKPDATQIYDDAPGNVCFDWEMGDAEKTKAALTDAAHVTTVDLINNRVICASMEPRGALGQYDKDSDRYTLHVGTQGVFSLRDLLAGAIMHIDPSRLQVISPDVGGAFGMKGFVYAEQPMVLWAAKELGRAVKWMSDRTEAFVTDTQGRDHVTSAKLALDKDGKILGVQVSTIANLGAYASQFGPGVPSLLYSRMIPGLYTTPAFHVAVSGVFTNTVPVDAYRGAGRPEAAYVIERLVDKAAREMEIAPDELRRRNYIQPSAMPYTTPSGLEYDSGDFAGNLNDALKRADRDGIESRKAKSKAAGRYRGLGIATYIEATGADPKETAKVEFEDDGTVALTIGTLAGGQGHLTTFAQILHDRLGVPFDKTHVHQGDSDALPQGGGTAGSRSLVIGGGAVQVTADKIKDKATKIAAHMMEAAEADIEFSEGTFTIAGTDRTMNIMEIAAAAKDASNLPDGMEPGLDHTDEFMYLAPTFPNGAHICEVEIDPDTGTIDMQRYTVVDDFGKVINPLLVYGQVHGGIAQGVGQVITENCVYDPESGQLLTGSFMDYGMPRADDFPSFNVSTNEILCQTNAMGAKGAGEAGTLGALPAVINALVDALAPLGVTHIDMPATPESVWRAISAAKAA